MAENTLLQQIGEANKSFLAGQSKPLDPTGDRFVVLTCIDGRLTNLVEPALGLVKHRVLVIRNAGNRVSDSSQESLRSIAAAVYLKGAREVFVVGHTDCVLSQFSAAEVIDKFRGMGIPRSAFGDEDLRNWFGAFNDIKANVLQSIASIRKSGVLPASIKIHGLIMNIEDGRLDVILNGDLAPPEVLISAPQPVVQEPPPAVVQSPSPPVSIPDIPPPLPVIPGRAEAKSLPIVIPETKGEADRTTKATAPTSLFDAAMIFRDFFRKERRNQNLQRNLTEMGKLIKGEKDPAVILHELEKAVKEYQQQYPNLAGALAFSKRFIEGKGAGGANFRDMMRRILS